MSYSISINDSRPIVIYQDEIIKPLIKEDVENRRAIFGQNVINFDKTNNFY